MVAGVLQIIGLADRIVEVFRVVPRNDLFHLERLPRAAYKQNNRGIPSVKAEKQWLDSPESSLCSIIQRLHSLDFRLNLPPSVQF